MSCLQGTFALSHLSHRVQPQKVVFVLEVVVGQRLVQNFS